MDPDTINCMILHIDVERKIIPSRAIQQQTSVTARYGSKKNLRLNGGGGLAQAVEPKSIDLIGWGSDQMGAWPISST